MTAHTRFGKKQATVHGLSVEEWLKQKTATAGFSTDPRAPGELTVEERLARFDRVMDKIEKMDIGSDTGVDWSRETIYGENGL